MPNSNVQVVKDAYKGFEGGDSERLFGVMTPDIEWESLGRASDFPTLGSRRGKMEVREFFGLVAETLEFHTFRPREFHAVGNIVFVFGGYDATVRKTGRRVACEWLHVFWLSDGKITRFHEYTDTARFAEAWRANTRVGELATTLTR